MKEKTKKVGAIMKKLFALLVTLGMLLSLCGCAAAGDPSQSYGLILTDDAPYLEQIRTGFESAARQQQIPVIVRYAATVEEQLQAIADLKGSIAGLAIRPADTTGLKNALNDLSFPVVTIDADTEGSDYYIDHGDPTLCARAMLDELLTRTGGGKIAVLGSNRFSGMNAWVNAMKNVIREEKYAGLIWIETVYCDPDAEAAAAETQALLTKYPDLEAICCPDTNILLGCCRALEAADTQVWATGMGNPSTIKDYVGNNMPCPALFAWDYARIGQCAFETIHHTASAPLSADATAFTGISGTVYDIKAWSDTKPAVTVGTPARYDEETITQWIHIFG